MITRKPPTWLYCCVAVTAILAFISMSLRYKVEQRNKAVAVACELDSVEALSSAQGTTTEKGLNDLKLNGLNAIVLSEETVGELLGSGSLLIQPSPDGSSVTLNGSADTLKRVARAIQIRFPKSAPSVGAGQLQVPLEAQIVRGVSVGLNPYEAKLCRDSGMLIIARFSNPDGASDETVVKTLEWAKEMGATSFLPQGDQVLGRRDSLDVMVDTLKRLGMTYASPEFAKMGGDENVVEKAPDVVIRLHSAQEQEIDKLPFDEVLDRYSRAAKERNQRILLVRPVSYAAPQPLKAFADFTHRLDDELRKDGFIVAESRPFEDSEVPMPLLVLLALSILPTAYWTAQAFITNRNVLLIGLGLLALLGLACVKPIGRPYIALIGAITFPITAFLALDGRRGKSIPVEYVITSLISLVGGFCVAGMINSLPYFVRAQQFPGVKLAHFGPILVIGLYFFWRLCAAKQALKSPILWSQSILALLILAALIVMEARTGNDNPAAVSGLELKFRAVLDMLLFVRPRTKEFLIGNPLMIVAIGSLIAYYSDKKPWKDRGGWVALALMCGAIGQTSIVNTMCHIHTPLTISLARIMVGLVAGGIIGGALWGVIKSR